MFIYFRDARRGNSKPNTASWLIWWVVSLVNVLTYQYGTGDWVKTINAYVATINCTLMLGYCLFRGQIKEVRKWDVAAMFLAAVAIVCWHTSGEAWYGNVFVQCAVVISFTVTLVGLAKGTHRERALPWGLWTSCHVLSFSIVILRWDNQLISLLYPLLGILLNASTTLTAHLKNKQAQAAP
jgi:hypothetical protein